MNTKIDPGKGYRLLKDGEIVTAGDECYCFSDGSWFEAAATEYRVGCRVLKGLIYRRKVEEDKPDPGPEYRLLKAGEVIQPTDEVLFGRNTSLQQWDSTGSYGYVIEDNGTYHGLFYRRKVEEKPKIDPGEGYRLLAGNEIIQEDDEFQRGHGWLLTNNPGVPAGDPGLGGLIYRRKVEVPIQKQLADAKEALTRLYERHAEVVKEKDNLVAKIQEISKENMKLQQGINTRNEHIKDLEFVIRKLRLQMEANRSKL